MQVLSEVETLLLDLEKRLQFSAVPLRDWLSEAASLSQYARLAFLKDVVLLLEQSDLETAWHTAVESMAYLLTEDVSVLKRIGTQLGKSDTATQLACIRETVSSIAANKEKAIQKAQKASRLYVGLGTCAGMALALLLI